MNKVPQQSGGFALLLALIVSSVALSIGLSLLDITVKQLTLGSTSRESEVAFQVAATAMNCLQFARNTDLLRSQTKGGSFQIDCVGLSFDFNDSGNSPSVIRYTNEDGNDWYINGRDRCIQYDMFVLLATAGDDVSVQNTVGETITCDGDAGTNICTFAYARGHNRGCTELNSGTDFVVQRELTAEF